MSVQVGQQLLFSFLLSRVCVTRGYAKRWPCLDFAVFLTVLMTGRFTREYTFHDLPTEKGLRKAWIHAIRRDVGRYFYIVPGSTKVCSIHFRDEDFRQPSASASARRRAKLKQGYEVATRTYRLLRPGAIPSIFPSFAKGPAPKVGNHP